MGSHQLDEQYEADGFCGPILFINSSEALEIIHQIKKRFNGFPSGNDRFKLHLVLDKVSRLAHQTNLVQAVKRCLQSQEILLWSSDLNVKPPKSSWLFSPHQDSTYAGLQPAEKCLTCWIALTDPVGVEEGCMEFWRGSHRDGQVDHCEDGGESNLLSRGQYIPGLNIKEATPAALRTGEATFHSFLTVHHSGPNTSTSHRVGLALRYIAADVCQTGSTKESVSSIDGAKVPPWFLEEPILSESPSPHEVALGEQFRDIAIRSEAQNYFQGRKDSDYS